jgi:hypothetical protein
LTTTRARARAVERLRDALLAGAALAADVQRRAALGRARDLLEERLHRRSAHEAVDAAHPHALERPHVGARHQQRVADADDPLRQHRLVRGGELAIHEGAVLAAEIGDDAAPAFEREPRVAARDAPVIELAGAGIAAPQLDGTRREPEDPGARSASREHHDDTGDVLGVAGVVAERAGGKGRWIHAAARNIAGRRRGYP